MKHNPIKFIPIVNLLMLTGIYSYNIEAIAEIKVKILDAKQAMCWRSMTGQ